MEEGCLKLSDSQIDSLILQKEATLLNEKNSLNQTVENLQMRLLSFDQM